MANTHPANEAFLKELEKLNPQQKEAVNHIEGPVLVIAGPGTGKTQILAARIGNILLKTDAQPHNILCLTYTDAGAIAMRRRLLSFIGPDAYRVHINTFHSFCNGVIQDNLDYFGLRKLEPLGELEKIELLHEIINEFDGDNPLKRWKGEVYYETGRLDKLFQIMKKESWSPEFICQKAEEYLAELPFREEFIYKKSGKGYKAGDLKQNAIDEETRKKGELMAAAKAFHRYQELLKERGRYDYADMILWVSEAFKNDENLLRNYQERYLYYLVDEFQDTGGAQSELLDQLISYWDSPNVFVVGDDDQSIYAFQDANIRNILNFASKYGENLKSVMMTANYRSVQQVLDIAEKVIENNTERLVNEIQGLEKRLISAHIERQAEDIQPVIRQYHNCHHETVGIAKEIEQLHLQEVPLDQIAVIYRNHKQVDDMVQYFEAKSIPLNIKKRMNVLDQPLIRQILTILQYIQLEMQKPHTGEHLLFEILHYDFLGLKPLDIAQLSLKVSKQNYKERNSSFRQEMAKPEIKTANLFEAGGNVNPFKHASSNVEYWLAECKNLTLQQLIEKIINRGGILRKALQSPEKTWVMELVHTFFEFVKDECAKDTRMHIDGFLKKIDLMERYGIDLPVYKVSYASKGVNFITAHSSKGLEFDYVFLIGCNSDTWDKKGHSGTYTLPDNMSSKTDVDQMQEARRLFYVALTRAKRYLYISYAGEKTTGKALEKSRFVAEALQGTGISEEFIALENQDLIEFQLYVTDVPDMPDAPLVDKAYLDELLQKYSMSVTHLSNYLRCPLSFYFTNIIKVPRAKSPSMTFGSAVHFALEQLFKKMIETKEFHPVEEVVRDFAWYMKRNEDSFTPQDFELKNEYGKRTIEAYYNRYVNEWNKIVVAERAIRNLEMNGIPVNGKIDKIEFEGTNINVIDYKTGNYEYAKPKFKRPDPDKDPEKATYEDLMGGDYWRQAVFYKLLIDNDRTKSWKMVSCEFDFVEPDKKTSEFLKEKVYITKEDEEIVREQIKSSYKKIMSHEFPGCGKSDCDWCNFARYNYKVPEAVEFPPEELSET